MKKHFALLLIVLLVVTVSACGGEEVPTVNSSEDQTVYIKIVNNSGENIALDSSSQWDDEYLDGSYHLDVEDFQLAPGEESNRAITTIANWDDYEETGASTFRGKYIGIAAPITEEDLMADYKCSQITVAQWVDVEASYGDTILLKWDGLAFEAEIIKGE